MKFRTLRETEWNPSFEWVKTRLECADKINSYHEDYPNRVSKTDWMLGLVPSADGKIYSGSLLMIHEVIFSDKPFAGKWRDVGVIVGQHHPPIWENIAKLMDELESFYAIQNIETLIEWYKDFETIHPFQDGNGRVGGVIVAIYAHKLHPDKGWLAPNQ